MERKGICSFLACQLPYYDTSSHRCVRWASVVKTTTILLSIQNKNKSNQRERENPAGFADWDPIDLKYRKVHASVCICHLVLLLTAPTCCVLQVSSREQVQVWLMSPFTNCLLYNDS